MFHFWLRTCYSFKKHFWKIDSFFKNQQIVKEKSLHLHLIYLKKFRIFHRNRILHFLIVLMMYWYKNTPWFCACWFISYQHSLMIIYIPMTVERLVFLIFLVLLINSPSFISNQYKCNTSIMQTFYDSVTNGTYSSETSIACNLHVGFKVIPSNARNLVCNSSTKIPWLDYSFQSFEISDGFSFSSW